jgi:hypothetical protein
MDFLLSLVSGSNNPILVIAIVALCVSVPVFYVGVFIWMAKKRNGISNAYNYIESSYPVAPKYGAIYEIVRSIHGRQSDIKNNINDMKKTLAEVKKITQDPTQMEKLDRLEKGLLSLDEETTLMFAGSKFNPAADLITHPSSGRQ